MFNFKGVTNKSSRWWFQICFFHPYYWEDSHYDRYVLDGLKPPTSQRFPRKQGEQKRESMCKSYVLFHLFHCKYIYMDIITRITWDGRSKTVRFQTQLSMYQSINTMFKNGKRQKNTHFKQKTHHCFQPGSSKGCWMDDKGVPITPSLGSKQNPWKMLEPVQDPFFWKNLYRWWFQLFFIFTPIWGRFPTWLIFFWWVETANQLLTYTENFVWKFSTAKFTGRWTQKGLRLWRMWRLLAEFFSGPLNRAGCMVCLPTFGWFLRGKYGGKWR